MQKTLETTHLESGVTPAHETETHATTEHAGPHILNLQGDGVGTYSIFGFSVTTTIVSTWILMLFLFVGVGIFYTAIKTRHFPRVKTFGLDAIDRLYSFLTSSLGDRKNARKFLPLIGSLFVFIFFGNIFGLILDWINLSVPSMHAYLRPINSDMNTTVVLALLVIVTAQSTGIINKGIIHHFGHYFFNFSGNTIIEKIINVPVGWIHFLGEFTRVLSLSVRLFANIFAGVALISVMAYIGTLIPMGPFGGILVLPFWFFEIMVAFLQAFIFIVLTSVYFKEALPTEGHH